MYNYSPISKIYVKNFRNIGEAVIDFEESPIACLVGENEAGKTSIIKAFAVCAAHINARGQKDFIRTGTKMFGVAIDLKDGTRITRIKETSVNSYEVKRPDGTVWSTNKITDGLPVEVSKVMGLIEEPETNEFLHIRTYEDKLLFVVTPNSTNYKVMYNSLKVEQLTKAIKLGSAEVNQLRSEINSNEIRLETLGNQMRDITIIDTDTIVTIKNRLKEQLQTLDKLDRLKTLSDNIERCKSELGALALLDKFSLSEISELEASKLNTISRLLNNINELTNCESRFNELSTLENIDTSILNKVQTIIYKKDELDKKLRDAGSLVDLSNLDSISEVITNIICRVKTIQDDNNTKIHELNALSIDECDFISEEALDCINKSAKVIDIISFIDSSKTEVDRLEQEIGKINDYMKGCGIAVETCSRCGETIIFDIDKLG